MKELKDITDLGHISALMALGYSPISRRKEGKRAYFTFEVTPDIEQILMDFDNQNLLVDAKTLLTTQKSVKSTIYRMT